MQTENTELAIQNARLAIPLMVSIGPSLTRMPSSKTARAWFIVKKSRTLTHATPSPSSIAAMFAANLSEYAFEGPLMAIHPNSSSLTVEVIEEYLDIANLCINTKKPDGGIYGYPATLLLFCVIEALGTGLRKDKNPFQVLREPPFNCTLSFDQVKDLKEWYRNPLAHNGMIVPGICLSPEDSGAPFTFSSNQPVLIRVKSLYDLVHGAWRQLSKGKLNSNWRSSTNPEIKNPIFLSGATASMPVTASGSIYVAPRRASGRIKKS